MFLKAKGAFILGCTSPLKAIMIDRPGMGKVVHIAQRNQKRRVKEKSVNQEKHEKGKMTEDSNTHGSEETSEWKKDVYSRKREKGSTMYMQKNRKSPEDR